MEYIEHLAGIESPGGFMASFELERPADPEPLHLVKPGTGARAASHSAWAAPGPGPGGQLPRLLAELGWLATKETAGVLWRSAFLGPSLLAAAARRIYPWPRDSEQPVAPGPAGPAENGAGVVVDLAAYRQHARLARGRRLAQNAQPPG